MIIGIIFYTGVLPISVRDGAEIRSYAPIALILGIGWLTLPIIWITRHHFGQKFLTANYWIASWLVPAWLALAVAGSQGLLSNYSPDVKLFLEQPEVKSVLENNSINFVVQTTETMTTGGDKALLLLTLYTPHWGQRFKKISEVPKGNYAWASPEPSIGLSAMETQIATFRDWKLIQLGNN